MLEGDPAADRLGYPGLVFVQLRLRVDQLEDAAGAGDAQLHQVEGEDGDEGGELERAHQPYVGHDLPQGDCAPAPEEKGVEEGAGPADAEDEHGPVAGLDLALLHEGIAEIAGVPDEAEPLAALLGVCFDHLDAGDGLG